MQATREPGLAGPAGPAVLLRDALPADAESIAKVHVLAWQHAYRGIFSDALLAGVDWRDRFAARAAQLASPAPGQVIDVAVRDGAVAGFASAGPARDDDLRDAEHLELYAIYLHPRSWASGIGGRLLGRTLRRAFELAPDAADVSLWVLERNHQARTFYERHGFRPDGRVKQYERAGETAVALRYRRPGIRRAPAAPPAGLVSRLRAAGCVFAEDEARLLTAAAGTAAELDAMADRRVAGLPLEQVVGWAEFCGLRIAVDPGVFVPRRRTEFLVREALAAARAAAGRPLVVVDLCCGSGALGVALAVALGQAELHAADIEPEAVACARRNAGPVGGLVYEGDLYQPLPARLAGRTDILVANVPYVPTGELPLLPAEARLHERKVALDGGADGLEVLRRVAAGAAKWLAPRGCLLIETSQRQAPVAAAAFADAGLVPRVASSQDAAATVIIGTRAAG